MRNKFSLTREDYIKTNFPQAIRVAVKGSPAEIYLYQGRENGAPCAAAFYGKQSKPEWRFRFDSEEKRAKYCDEWVRAVLARVEQKTKRQQERAAANKDGHGWKVGDVLYTCWGYEQTNVEYYQITALIGRTMVEVREIAAASVDTEFMQGRSVPELDQFIGEPSRHRVIKTSATDRGSISISSCITAWPLAYKEVAGVRVYESKNWTAYA